MINQFLPPSPPPQIAPPEPPNPPIRGPLASISWGASLHPNLSPPPPHLAHIPCCSPTLVVAHLLTLPQVPPSALRMNYSFQPPVFVPAAQGCTAPFLSPPPHPGAVAAVALKATQPTPFPSTLLPQAWPTTLHMGTSVCSPSGACPMEL